jgi:hypothetical protein
MDGAGESQWNKEGGLILGLTGKTSLNFEEGEIEYKVALSEAVALPRELLALHLSRREDLCQA